MSSYERYREAVRRREHLREIDKLVLDTVQAMTVVACVTAIILSLSGAVWLIGWVIGD